MCVVTERLVIVPSPPEEPGTYHVEQRPRLGAKQATEACLLGEGSTELAAEKHRCVCNPAVAAEKPESTSTSRGEV